MFRKCIRTGHPLEAAGAEHRPAEFGQEFGDLYERGPGGVPLEEQKLDIVLGPAFAGAESVGELVDRPEPAAKSRFIRFSGLACSQRGG